MKDNSAIKKQTVRPADPKLIAAPAEEHVPETLQLKGFADGYLFKFCAHPTRPGLFVIFGGDHQPVAEVYRAEIADLFCQCTKTVFDAVAAQRVLTDEERAANNLAHKEQRVEPL